MKNEMPTIQDWVKELGLRESEYQRIVGLLGEQPSELLLRMFGAMWSEHCSYKSSRRWLAELPTEASWVLEGPGEGAGVVAFDDETAITFKMESHNHPSAVEPFQGAATGVGGIIRDIVSMGARPIALLDCLRFAPPRSQRACYLLERVVAGIAWYGNCIGVPIVGGELEFAACYEDNPLVNVMAVGVLPRRRILPSVATGVGNVVILYGAATGREGLHGATFASQDLDPSKQMEDRSSVQIGDPFLGKLLIESSLELSQQPYVVGLQDLGAAGLLCASSEMAARKGDGMLLDLDSVHLREPDMTPWEILLSETQERMMVCVERGRESEALALLAHWDVPARVVGQVTPGPNLELLFRGETVASVPAHFLTEESPCYDLPHSPGERLSPSFSPQKPKEMAQQQLSDPNLASRRWIYQQFDSMVGTQTLLGPGEADAAVLSLHGKSWSLALTAGGMPSFLRGNTRDAAIGMVAECTRELVAVGARPLAITNCLNFASPENPEVYEDLIDTITGMREACLAFQTPVTGGNVSLYNQSPTQAIQPTPVVGMIGKIESSQKVCRMGFSHEGDAIWVIGDWPEAAKDHQLVGQSQESLLQKESWKAAIASEMADVGRESLLQKEPWKVVIASEMADAGRESLLQEESWKGVGQAITGTELDLERCCRVNDIILEFIDRGVLSSCHDISHNVWLSAVESAICNRIGFSLDVTSKPLFAQGGHRFLVSFASKHLEMIRSTLKKRQVEGREIGVVGGESLTVTDLFAIPLTTAQGGWVDTITTIMEKTMGLSDPGQQKISL